MKYLFQIESYASYSNSQYDNAVASPEYYDEVYFDSDDSSDGEVVSKNRGVRLEADAESSKGETSRRRSGKKVRKLTNDELFYDPNMDEEDEKWVRRQRMSYHNGMERICGGWVGRWSGWGLFLMRLWWNGTKGFSLQLVSGFESLYNNRQNC